MKNLDLHQPSAWSGVWTALVTPLTRSAGALVLDRDSLKSLIDAQITGGVRGLVIAGSTGEGSLLSSALYEDLLKQAHALASDRIPLVAGLGIGGTEACLKNAHLAKELGYQGVLASPPAYIKAPQRGLVEHYLALGEVGLPVCLYEIAGRAASSIEIATLVELAQSAHAGAKNLVAIKDASANLQRALDEKRALGDRFALLSGDDGTFAPFVCSGGVGVVSVVSHLVPRALGKILQAALKGDTATALSEQNRINPLVEALFWESNPVPVKSLLAKRGAIASATFCKPLLSMKPELLDRLAALAQKIEDIAT
jgi:4-hydroxy-tetrahydrodipicolinate synthase